MEAARTAPLSAPVLGTMCCFLQAILSVSSVALQRASKLRNDELPAAQQRPNWQRPMWVAGFALYLGSQPLTALAVTLTPLSTVSLVGCATSILCSVFSARSLGESYYTTDKLSVVFALVGSVGAIRYGPQVEDLRKTLDSALRLLHFWHHPGLCVQVPVMVSMLIATLMIMRSDEARKPRMRFPLVRERSRQWLRRACRAVEAVVVRVGSVCCIGPKGSLRQKAFDTMVARRYVLAAPMAAALAGSTSEAATKVFGLYVSMGHRHILENLPQFLSLALVFAVCTMTSAVVVTHGAETLASRYFVPAYSCTSTLLMQIFAMLEFAEFDVMSVEQIVYFAFPACCCLISVVLGSIHLDDGQPASKGDSFEDQLERGPICSRLSTSTISSYGSSL